MLRRAHVVCDGCGSRASRASPDGRQSGPCVQSGFTLVELIIVIVITAIIGATIAVMVKPAADAYSGSQYRAEVSDLTDTALRRMVRDVRLAVPNSLRVPTSSCFELVPAYTGGRFRMGPNAAGGGAWVDPSQATTSFDVLSTLSSTPAVGDWVVINNQNGNDVYAGNDTAQITSVSTPAAADGTLLLGINSLQVSTGYNGGRFLVISNSQQAVDYICSGADGTLDGSGSGKGTLYRLVRSFVSTYPTSCPSTTGADIVATRVQSCTFVYSPNQGQTQQSGFLWMQLVVTRNNQTATQAIGAHVSNVP